MASSTKMVSSTKKASGTERERLKRDELLRNIERDVTYYFNSGKRHNITDATCSVGAIVAGVLPLIFTLLNVPSIMAALPGLLATAFVGAQRLINFRARSAFFFNTAAQYKKLALELRFQNANVTDISERYGLIHEASMKRWSEMMGASSTASDDKQLAAVDVTGTQTNKSDG